MKTILYNRFKFYRNNIIKFKRKAKINHSKNFSIIICVILRIYVYKGINKLITSKESTNSTKISLKIKNTTESPVILANEFNRELKKKYSTN